MKLIGSYTNGNFTTEIYDDGTKRQVTMDDTFNPDFPECMDITITEQCSNNCSFCYANCTPQGQHCDFEKYQQLLDSIHPYTEIAINGNNLNIPHLEDFLIHMQEKKVIVNMTVNQIDFEKNWEYLKRLEHKKLIRGLGISLNKVSNDFLKYLQFFPNAVLHVINGIFSPDDYKVLKDRDLKLLILGYKEIGRGQDWFFEDYKRINWCKCWLKTYLPEMTKHFKVISFDNLALEQLDVKKLITDEQWERFYMGDEGTISFFINLVQGYFAMNSMSPNHYPIKQGMTIDDMFRIIRQK